MRSRIAMNICNLLVVMAISSLVVFAPSGVLAEQEPKEVATSQGLFPLDERGLPEQETIPALFDEMDYQGAVQAYLWAMPQMAIHGQRKMNEFYGAKGSLALMTTYMDPSVYGFTTPNRVVRYIWNVYNFEEMGPMVMEMPGGQFVGLLMDYQMRFITDIGLTSKAGDNPETIVFLGPNQSPPDEALAKGWRIERCRTNMSWLGLRILSPSCEDPSLVKKFRIYPWSQRKNPQPNPVFQAKPNDKIYHMAQPRGMAYWEDLHEIIQQERVLDIDRYFMNSLKAVGIEKGKPFKPTKRQMDILERAAFTGEKMAMAVSFVPRSEQSIYRKDTRWFLPLTLQPEHMTEYTQQFEERVAWTYTACGVSPSMQARVPGKGSTYFATYHNADGDWLDGGKSYKFTVAPNPPAAQMWVCSVYELENRSVIQNGEDQRTEISSLSKGLEANPDGSIDLYFGPEAPAGKESNWIKTNKDENWFVWFRLYAPTEKYFDRSWPMNDIKEVK
jgi:hypothetical protein